MLYRNGWNAYSGVPTFLSTGDSYLTLVQTSEVPMYHWSGWFDYFVFNQPTWFPNLEQPQKMAIGPWVHTDRYGETDLAAVEHLRWYDYWLKGINNGIMKEAPVNYYTMGASEGKEWRSAWDWPVPGVQIHQVLLRRGIIGERGFSQRRQAVHAEAVVFRRTGRLHRGQLHPSVEGPLVGQHDGWPGH